jgi:hypothetical protein
MLRARAKHPAPNHDGEVYRSSFDARARRDAAGGRVPFTGIAGQERLRLLRQGNARLLRRPAHDPEIARQFFDPPLQSDWVSSKPPFDFLIQSTRWMLGAVSIAVIRKQLDKTYVAVAFSNNQRAVSLNFVIINGPDGWVISDVESPHDSLRSFLAQHRN